MMIIGESQQQIAEYLDNIEPNAGSIYLGALVVLENERNPDRISQSAHSIREVVAKITRKIDSSREKQENVKKNALKKKLEKLATPIGTPTTKIISPYQKLGDLHNEFLGITHHGPSPPSLKQYLKKIEAFELLISSLIRPFFLGINEIDTILAKLKPTKKEIDRILELTSKDLESNRYFYENAGSNWLQILINKELFVQPNKIEEVEGKLSFKPWFESSYLLRIAKDEPQKVCNVILKCNIPKKSIERDPWMLSDFVLAALKMPLNQASKIGKLAVKKNWVEAHEFSKLNSDLAELMMYLAEKGNIKDALLLAQKLFNVRIQEMPSYSFFNPLPNKEVKSVLSFYSFENIMQTKLYEIGKIYPKETIEFLVNLLRLIIRLNNKSKKFQGIHDNSHSWWPSIEDSSQNSHSDIKGVVITHLRKLLEHTNSNNLSIFKYSFNLLKKQNSSIFTRFLLFQCKLRPNLYKKDMEKLLIENFENGGVTREYYLCMKKVYPKLSPKIKKKILNLISEGPNIKYYLRQKRKIGKIPTEKEIETRKKRWTVSRLQAIIEHLPAHKEQYKKLVSKVGEWPYPGFTSYVGGMAPVEPVSELNESMTLSQVFKYIQSYKIPENKDWVYDGTGKIFRDFVEKDPFAYSKNSKHVLNADPTFSYQLLSGISNAIRETKKVDWKSTISLCDYITDPKNKEFDKIQGSVFREILSILEEGLQSNNSPSFTFRKNIWKILEQLDKLKEKSSKKYSSEGFDSHGIAINSIRGKTLHTVIRYNDWCNMKQKTKPKKLYSEVKKLLSSHIKIKNDDTISTRAVFGFFFPHLYYLDKNLIENNKSEIITSKNIDLNNAFWDSYLWNNVHEKPFVLLHSEFKKRIMLLKKYTKKEGYGPDPNTRIITHVAIAYFSKIKKGKELLELILKNADDQYIEHLIHSIAYDILKPIKESGKSHQNLKLIKELFKNERIKKNKNLGEWFVNSPFERKFSISMLSTVLTETNGEIESMLLVPREMITYAKDFPKETLECLEKILKFYTNKHNINFNQDSIREILQETYQNKNITIKNKAEKLIHLMGSMGFTEFRKLL